LKLIDIFDKIVNKLNWSNYMHSQALSSISRSLSLPALGCLTAGMFLWSHNPSGHEESSIPPIALDILEVVAANVVQKTILASAILWTAKKIPFLDSLTRFPRIFFGITWAVIPSHHFHYFYKYNIDPSLCRWKVEYLQSNAVSCEKKSLLLHYEGEDGEVGCSRNYLLNIAELAKNHVIQRTIITDIMSSEEIDRSIELLPEQEYDVLWIRSHGIQRGIALGAKNIDMFDTQALFALVKKMKNGGRIILEVCEAGEGEKNIAKAFSESCPTCTVYAPSENTRMSYGMRISKEGTPYFGREKGGERFSTNKNITRAYRSGKDL
jgi:hypothetical protein